LPKRLSENEKEQILKSFTEGLTIDKLSEKYKFTKLTISRNLKKILGESRFKELSNKNKKEWKIISNEKRKIDYAEKEKLSETIEITNENNNVFEQENFIYEQQSQKSEFFEIAPLKFNIDHAKRKDLSSVPLENVDLPNIVYMIVDKSIELEIKLLNEYPDWRFLPAEDLNRKTIQVFYDLKNAKRNCNKNQKVLKVPNSKVFEMVSPILRSRGISRMITEEYLISL
tara:strand:+ start:4214 stop:4897 length:684 start_codon:yes stop_codon:yes gene_type:complete